MNSLIDSVRFIPLETIKESLFVNEQYRFGVIGQNMFISGGGVGMTININSGGRSDRSAKAVLQFDFDGNYIGQIAPRGQGPHELVRLDSWYTHDALQQLNAEGNYKMVIKSFKNDKTTDVRMEITALDVIPLSDGSFVAVGPPLIKEYKDRPYLYFLDANGRETASMKYPEERDIYSVMPREGEPGSGHNETRNVFPRFSGYALFKDAYNDTTYLIKSAEDIKPYLVFKRGKYIPLIKDANDIDRKSRQIFIRNIKETEDYIFLTTIYKRKYYFDIWQKKDRQLFSRAELDTNSSHHYVSTFTGGFGTYYELPNGDKQLIDILYVEEDAIYAIIEAEVAKTFIEGIHEEDNPVIMVAKLKPAKK